ncbi:hypothetical protein EK904_006660, partial [Melospiza melodia maxima]
ELPAPLLDDSCRKELGDEAAAVKSEDSQDSMKIAWRYQNLPKMERQIPGSTQFVGAVLILWKRERLSPTLIPAAGWIKDTNVLDKLLKNKLFVNVDKQRKKLHIKSCLKLLE